MNRFFNLLSISALLLVLAIGCSDSEDTSEFKLSIAPHHNLAFSAAATESFDIEVTTNQPLWDASSDQEWCVVIKTKGKFMVQAVENSSPEAPAKATITVSANRAKMIKIEVTQAGVGAQLDVVPNDPISLSSDGSREVELDVVTNQSSWSASSNQNWCNVSRRGLNGITLKANANESGLSREASITISAGSAANATIIVTQYAEGEGSMVDNGKTIWGDSHWRLYSLRGKPRSVIGSVNGEQRLLEFTPSGRVTYEGHPDRTTYLSSFEYDQKDRLVKNSYSKDGIIESFSYEYGNHTKYVPSLINFHNTHNGINLLSKGLSVISHTDAEGVVSRFEFRVTAREIISDFPYNGKFKATYSGSVDSSGDYPSGSVLTTVEGDKSNITKYEFKYGTNYKYSEMLYNLNDGYIVTTKYSPIETIYLLPIREEYLLTTNLSIATREYDDDFQLVKYTDDSTIHIYSDYRVDSYGNWVERKVDGVAEVRTIEYY